MKQRWIKVFGSVALLGVAAVVDAKPGTPPRATPTGPTLAVLAEVAGDDARTAVAIGADGQVYNPDGKGGWVRTQAITTADRVQSVGRANGIVVLAEGVVYRLADNGWSALRLAQKGKALMSSGDRAVAVSGRQVLALDRTVNGEPAKLAIAPAPVSLVGAGAKSVVIQTERGLLRQTGTSPVWRPVAKPKRVDRLVDDHWALVSAGVVDLDNGITSPWPAGFRVAAVTPFDAGSSRQLLAVGMTRRGVELVTFGGARAKAKVPKRPRAKNGGRRPPKVALPEPPSAGELVGFETRSVPVGVVADRSGRVVVAFRDGTLAIRERGVWTTATISQDLPADRPGAPPARSP